jgi:hypothetical protein
MKKSMYVYTASHVSGVALGNDLLKSIIKLRLTCILYDVNGQWTKLFVYVDPQAVTSLVDVLDVFSGLPKISSIRLAARTFTIAQLQGTGN